MVCRNIALSIVAVTAFVVAPDSPRAQQSTEAKASDPTTVTIDDKSIGGTVTSRLVLSRLAPFAAHRVV
jgi:hypothetical protein